MSEKTKIKSNEKDRIIILFINLKGGSAKTTGASISASYIKDSTLIEVDKINRSDSRINGEKYYKSIQADFNNESSDAFLKFENELLIPGNKIIDVGAVKLEIFHKAMIIANLYELIDLIVIPAMDGNDDFVVALDYLESIKEFVPSNKIMFSFNRFNEHEYSSVEEQFESFFLNVEQLKEDYKIDLNNQDNYFVLKDSRAVKRARKMGVTLRSIAEENLDEITKKQREEKNEAIRLELGRHRSLINTAQFFEKNYIFPMIEKINKKIVGN